MAETFVIAGASLAGGTAAITLREEGFDGRVILIGAEDHLPYERPPLSKQYLRGEMPEGKMLLRPAEFYAANAIELKLGSAARRVETGAKVVELASGERIAYDKLLIATGGRNKRPPIPGIDLDGVYDLRVIGDADRIRAVAEAGKNVVVVGMGFIGSEVSASLRAMGLNVTVIEGKGSPLGGLLGAEISGLLETVHRENGVAMHFGEVVSAFEGVGHVERVTTRSGLAFECDFAVVGIGIQPQTELVADTDIKVDNGILVDEYCRTSVADVFAAGDVANHLHPIMGQHIRVEHWQNAIRQGSAAARSMMGRGEPYREVHWFWSDQYDVNIQYAGFHVEGSQVVTRGEPSGRRFIAFHLKDGVLLAAVVINRARDLTRSIPLIASGQRMDAAALADESVDLRTLVAAPAM
jgi:3-phenylpropionate/trans-cinnamate dioxygenase ferredoxin reductase subunit